MLGVLLDEGMNVARLNFSHGDHRDLHLSLRRQRQMCIRDRRVLDSTLAMHHEAGPSVQMMRVRFCLEAAEKPSYPAAYGILAMRMSTFLLLLSYVVWPRHMMVRRATSARGGVVGPALRLMGRRDGLREASLRCLGGLPPLPAPF